MNKKCIAIIEPRPPFWNNNLLCLPSDSKIELIWSHNGKPDGLDCIRLNVPEVGSFFEDNYLC